MKKLLIPALATLLSIPVSAAVPNTFVAGTPAKAAEVNANFQALDANIKKAACSDADDARTNNGADSLSYTSNAVAVGSNVSINGVSYTIIKTPFIDFATGDIYELTIPYHFSGGVSISFSPADKDLTCNDFLIDGYSGAMELFRSYKINLGTNASYNTSVSAEWSIYVNETVINIFIENLFNETVVNTARNGETNISNIVNLSGATFNHNNGLTAFDNFIDYIQIQAVP